MIQKVTEEYFGTDNKIIGTTIDILKESIERARENDKSKVEIDRIENLMKGLDNKIGSLTEKLLEHVITNDTYKIMVEKYEKERESLISYLRQGKHTQRFRI